MSASGSRNSDWLLRRRFGSGAGQLLIARNPEAIEPAHVTWSHTWADARAQGTAALLGGTVRLLATTTLMAALVWTGLVALERDRSADDLLVLRMPPPPQVVAPLPPPVLEPVEVARIETPPPAPAAPSPRATPAPRAPVPEVPAPAPRQPAPPQVAKRPLPRLAIEPMPAPPVLAETTAPATRRVVPVASPRAGPPVHLKIDPLAEGSSFRPAAPPSARTVRAAVPVESRASRPRLALTAPDPGPWRESSLPAAPAPPAARSARAAPTRNERRRTPPAGLASPRAQAPVQLASATLEPARRAARAQPNLARSNARHDEAEQLEAVPLSALDACVSDRVEDDLKLSVVAALGARDRCVSGAGRYRFVETKNLNAFLMWIERAPSREHADRCIELQLALECLRGRGQGKQS